MHPGQQQIERKKSNPKATQKFVSDADRGAGTGWPRRRRSQGRKKTAPFTSASAIKDEMPKSQNRNIRADHGNQYDSQQTRAVDEKHLIDGFHVECPILAGFSRAGILNFK
jgi:hypothetical protein